MENKPIKVVNEWSLACNPLHNLTQSEITSLISNMRHGNDVQIQIAFAEIERQMPIFGVCINKRSAAIVNKKWDIIPIDDDEDSKIQAKLIKDIFVKSDNRNIDGFTQMLKHLVLSNFRGRACVKPFFDNDGNLIFKKIQNWNTLAWNDKLYWNPKAEQNIIIDNDGNYNIDLEELTEDEVLFIIDDRPIDIPGLSIYLRQIIGENNWARFVEKSGIPQVILTAPEGIPVSELNKWQARALQIFEGASGTLSYGTDVKLLTEGRGQDPFTNYVNHQMEMICLLALGEKLTTLGGSTGLGSNLAEIQSAEFNSLVNQDAKSIQNCINRCLIKKVAKHLGFDKISVQFKFIENENISANEYIDMAVKLHGLGISIDTKKLKELTNISFIKDDISEVWSLTNNDT